MIIDHLSEPTKHAMDVFAVTALIGTLLKVLPSIILLATGVWTAMRIVEAWLSIRDKWLAVKLKKQELER